MLERSWDRMALGSRGEGLERESEGRPACLRREASVGVPKRKWNYNGPPIQHQGNFSEGKNHLVFLRIQTG